MHYFLFIYLKGIAFIVLHIGRNMLVTPGQLGIASAKWQSYLAGFLIVRNLVMEKLVCMLLNLFQNDS